VELRSGTRFVAFYDRTLVLVVVVFVVFFFARDTGCALLPALLSLAQLLPALP
jgi:hypothetical protein